MNLFSELRRRNVFRMALLYLGAAWLIMQVVDLLIDRGPFPEPIGPIALTVLAIGFPIALILSWFYEIAPGGISRDEDVAGSASIANESGRSVDLIVIALLGAALLLFAYDKWWSPEPPERSIAVLPFVNMSDDASNEYFSDGVSEELLNGLARIPDLRVISRSSAFSYKGKDIKLAQVAEELNVAHILEGSVRKAGNQVRITVQLIEAHSDTRLWSETYDRTLDDIFAIQDDIAATVVDQLKITMLGETTQLQEVDPKAYALYLQARYLGRLNTAEGYEQSNALFEQALTIDPDYAAAWIGLAFNYNNQANQDLRPRDEGYDLAREATEQALALDPDYGPAHGRLGWIAMVHDYDLAAAARHFERALQLDPADPSVLGSTAVLLRVLGRSEQAIALNERKTARDPVNPIAYWQLAESYGYAGRWEDAIASYRTALRLSPAFLGTHYSLGTALLMNGEAEAALAEFTQLQDEEDRVKTQAMAFYALGRQEEYAAKLEELIDRWGDESPSEVAQVYAFAGDADNAFQWLERAVKQDEERALSFAHLVPFFRPIHADPRWIEFIRRTGTAPEQLDAIDFEVTLLE